MSKTPRKVLVIGAASAIAQEAARRFAESGDVLFLAGRTESKLKAVADDLRVRGAAKVGYFVLDVNEFDRHEALLRAADAFSGDVDTVLVAHGSLVDQKACEASFAEAELALRTNFLSTVSLLTLVANKLEARRGGSIAVISSVAGDRGRQSNYIYGTAKGALTVFLQGLRNRLSRSGVHVLTIKPGFVDTPMTTAFKKGPLWASPRTVGRAIHRAILARRDVVYVPWFWRWIMLVIRSIPERVFKRMSL